jgi:LPXTG-motif cell wall-anchored protein
MNAVEHKNEAHVYYDRAEGKLLDPIDGSVTTKTSIYGIKKIDGKTGEALSGATFRITGLQTEDVYSDIANITSSAEATPLDGVYRVDKFAPNDSNINDTTSGSGSDDLMTLSDEDESDVVTDEVEQTEIDGDGSNITIEWAGNGGGYDTHYSDLKCSEDGYLIIIGLPTDATVELTEISAPDGYNLLKDSETLQPLEDITATISSRVVPKISGLTMTTTVYEVENLKEIKAAIDKAGYVVENNQGILLPSTGGTGVTALYVLGGLMIVGAGTALVVRRRRQS